MSRHDAAAERVAREIVRDAILASEIPARSADRYRLLINAITTALLTWGAQRWREGVEDFYRRVNERAEADMLAGNPITGAHHRALEAEIAQVRALLPPPGEGTP